jgi:2-haloacid dehalogenase
MTQPAPSAVVFDLGGVLIDWNPRHMYRKLFAGDEAAMEDFLARVCTSAWNIRQDEGRSFEEGTSLLAANHPDKRALIEAWLERFDEMMLGPIEGTLEILGELRARGTPLYALTNWSAETYPLAERRFEFLRWFEGIVVSGRLKIVKPDRRIYQHLLTAYGLAPEHTLFIDDAPHNVTGAQVVGMQALHFTTPAALREALVARGLLPPVSGA